MQTIAVHIQVGKNQYVKPFCSFYYTHKYKNTLFSHETDLVFNQLDKSETFMSQLSLLFFSIFLLCHKEVQHQCQPYQSHRTPLWQGHQCSPLQRQYRRLVPKKTVGVWQGCLLSPTTFNIFLERIMTDTIEDHEGTVSTGGRTITNLRFPDDIDGLTEEVEGLANLAEHLDKASTAYGMEISA